MKNKHLLLTRLVFLLVSLFSLSVNALEYSGNIAVELQAFPQSGQFENQLDENLSFSMQPKVIHVFNNGNDEFSFEFFLREGGEDNERQHADIRELKWLHVSDDSEWRVGIDTVFWGVTESQHLVDVINQTDRLEGVDGEDKLGQPMIHYTKINDWGVLDAFVLLGFRKAEFSKEEGRLRFPLMVDADRAEYESSAEEKHVDVALRYSHTIEDTDFGLSVFVGTNREPLYRPGINNKFEPILIPYYEQMTQYGLDVQSIFGDWIWKFEMLYRDVDSGSFAAAIGGFEYTFYGVNNTDIDLGTLLEYSYRGGDNLAVFNNDIFAGMRIVMNDVQSTEVLMGLLVDTENQSQSFRIEANRRIGSDWKLTGELQIFTSIDDKDTLSSFAQDDYVLLELARYF